MGEKEERTWGRLELAEYFNHLSEQLRRGALEAQGRHWTVPEDLRARLEFKEKKGRLVAKLSWSWSTLRDYDRPAREEVKRWQDSLKAVKKRLGADFKKLQQAVSQGAFPDEPTLSDFVASSQALAAMAEPDWQGAMHEFLDHLANLQHAVAHRQPEVMRHELRDLQNRMASCHREFKSRGGTGQG
jgi:XXXCH domain-containing protein